jgi:nickel-dependent lactate racemase
VLIPDHTRSLPLSFLFRKLVEILRNAKRLDFMVALGTHPALSDESLNLLVGITAVERKIKYAKIGLLNHSLERSICPHIHRRHRTRPNPADCR